MQDKRYCPVDFIILERGIKLISVYIVRILNIYNNSKEIVCIIVNSKYASNIYIILKSNEKMKQIFIDDAAQRMFRSNQHTHMIWSAAVLCGCDYFLVDIIISYKNYLSLA